MDTSTIVTQNLGRTYKTYSKKAGVMGSLKGLFHREYTEKQALKNINLDLSEGQIIGLVGSNGAGKTTLLKILSGLIFPTNGSVTVLGYNPWERDYDFLKQISLLLGQKNQLWWDISARDSYSLLAKIYGIRPDEAKKRIADLAHMFQCEDVLDTQLRRLSLGERMKMEIIGALLHRPKILFLDEPTIGLDILAQSAIRNFLASYVKDYKPLIILTSHYMDDIAQLADKLLLISQGELVYNGTVDTFMQASEMSKKLIYRYQHEAEERSLVYHSAELEKVLHLILSQGVIADLKTEEVDFEEVIHQFLEKESRV